MPLMRSKAAAPGLVYVFDLTRRDDGVLVAGRFAEPPLVPQSSEATWQCVAIDDADALRQAVVAATLEWPALPDRASNDFIVGFVEANDFRVGNSVSTNTMLMRRHRFES
jgi:hypothetical protein